MRVEVTAEEWELINRFRSHALSNEERTILAHFRGTLHDGRTCKACASERYHMDQGITAGRMAAVAEVVAGVTPSNEERKS